MKQMTFGYSKGKTSELMLADEWFGYAESEWFSTIKSLIQRILNALSCLIVFHLQAADAMHTKYPLEPTQIYGTKQEKDQYRYCLDLIHTTEIGESQAMMEMVKNTYLNNLHDICTDIERMHMDPE